jgi:hypothetical protein
VSHAFQTAYQQSSPAKAGDPLLHGQQALARAKAFVWATSNGARERAPNDDVRVPVTQSDLLDEMADTVP